MALIVLLPIHFGRIPVQIRIRSLFYIGRVRDSGQRHPISMISVDRAQATPERKRHSEE